MRYMIKCYIIRVRYEACTVIDNTIADELCEPRGAGSSACA